MRICLIISFYLFFCFVPTFFSSFSLRSEALANFEHWMFHVVVRG
jgi:hypothetical protein